MRRWHWDTRGGPLVEVDNGAYVLASDVWKLLEEIDPVAFVVAKGRFRSRRLGGLPVDSECLKAGIQAYVDHLKKGV